MQVKDLAELVQKAPHCLLDPFPPLPLPLPL